MKAVWSYWYPKSQFVPYEEENLAKSIAISVQLAKEQFTKTELVTTTEGKKILVDKYGIQFDNVVTDLDQFFDILDINLWAFIKIHACNIQREPFVHIDNDFFLYSKLTSEVLCSDVFFEIRLNKQRYDYMIDLVKDFNYSKAINNNNFKHTFGFGVIGFNKLDVIKEWHSIAIEFVLNNNGKWEAMPIEHKHYLNQFFEQYFLSVLVQKNNLSIGLLSENETKYVHLFGVKKNFAHGIDYINQEYEKHVSGKQFIKEIN